MALLSEINRTGTTVIVCTHDSNLVDRMKKRVIEVEDGLIIRDEKGSGYTAEEKHSLPQSMIDEFVPEVVSLSEITGVSEPLPEFPEEKKEEPLPEFPSEEAPVKEEKVPSKTEEKITVVSTTKKEKTEKKETAKEDKKLLKAEEKKEDKKVEKKEEKLPPKKNEDPDFPEDDPDFPSEIKEDKDK